MRRGDLWLANVTARNVGTTTYTALQPYCMGTAIAAHMLAPDGRRVEHRDPSLNQLGCPGEVKPFAPGAWMNWTADPNCQIRTVCDNQWDGRLWEGETPSRAPPGTYTWVFSLTYRDPPGQPVGPCATVAIATDGGLVTVFEDAQGGPYRITYLRGAMRYDGRDSWSVHDPSGSSIWVVHANRSHVTIAPGSSGMYLSQADAERYEAGNEVGRVVPFTWPGGAMHLLNEEPDPANDRAGTVPPTFQVCPTQPEGYHTKEIRVQVEVT